MASKKSGDYYRYKTKSWFEEKGYTCEYLERRRRVASKGKVHFIKQDIFGADGLAINEKEIIFWQSKKGKSHIAEAIKKFSEFPFPPQVECWVVVWESYAREPEIVEASDHKK